MNYKNSYLNNGWTSSSFNNSNDSNNLLGSMDFSLSDINKASSNNDWNFYNNSNFGANTNLSKSLGGSGGTGTTSLLTSLIGNKDTPGWGSTAINLLKSGLGFYLGQQQLNQAEDTLNENKRQFNLNYDAQKALINDELAWQHKARTDRNSAYTGNLTQIA